MLLCVGVLWEAGLCIDFVIWKQPLQSSSLTYPMQSYGLPVLSMY